jgi:UDP-N-acetylmuramoylalanine--D-glutamate ligase
MQLADVAGARAVLIGVGEETLSAIEPIRRAGIAELVIFEPGAIGADQQSRLTALGIPDSAIVDELPESADLVLRSPGFPVHRPDVQALAAQATWSTTPTGLWIAVRGGSGTIVVSGTKGKSTTASLIQEGLEAHGVAATIVGNIGTAPWSFDPHLDGVAVVELSSYHGSDLLATGEIAVLTLLTDDHLDWHGSADQYRYDKLRIFSIDQPDGTPPRHRFALAGQPLPQRIEHAIERVDGVGDHRARNVALATAAVRAELELRGVEPPEADALAAFLEDRYPALPSRFETVAKIDGVTWIDDALASNPSATAAALERLAPGPAVLICGGHDRQVPLDPIIDQLATWPTSKLSLVWVGEEDARQRALASLDAVDVSMIVPDLHDAVIVASYSAHAGASVIFSPAAPTERTEGSWHDRSRAFTDAVAALADQRQRPKGGSEQV